MKITAGGLLPGDVVILAIFVFCALWKGSRGFYDSFAPLVVSLISAAAAFILSRLLVIPVVMQLYPWLLRQLLARMDLSAVRSGLLPDMASQIGKLLPDVVSNQMDRLGLEPGAFVQQALSSARPGDTVQRVAENAVSAMLLPVTRSVVTSLLFLLLFVFFKLVLSLFQRLLGGLFHLPVIRGLDQLGGALVGVLDCAVGLYVLLWLTDLVSPTIMDSLSGYSSIISHFF